MSSTTYHNVIVSFYGVQVERWSAWVYDLSCKYGGKGLNGLKTLRESSFNMTRGGGWRYWNSKLEILAAPLASGSIF